MIVKAISFHNSHVYVHIYVIYELIKSDFCVK